MELQNYLNICVSLKSSAVKIVDTNPSWQVWAFSMIMVLQKLTSEERNLDWLGELATDTHTHKKATLLIYRELPHCKKENKIHWDRRGSQQKKALLSYQQGMCTGNRGLETHCQLERTLLPTWSLIWTKSSSDAFLLRRIQVSQVRWIQTRFFTKGLHYAIS